MYTQSSFCNLQSRNPVVVAGAFVDTMDTWRVGGMHSPRLWTLWQCDNNTLLKEEGGLLLIHYANSLQNASSFTGHDPVAPKVRKECIQKKDIGPIHTYWGCHTEISASFFFSGQSCLDFKKKVTALNNSTWFSKLWPCFLASVFTHRHSYVWKHAMASGSKQLLITNSSACPMDPAVQFNSASLNAECQ